MIKRIVKLTFQAERTEEFLTIFNQSKAQIRAFPGCRHLELWQQQDDHRVFFTYSYWDGAEDLEHYRHSDLFRRTWKATKTLFAERAVAWSVQLLEEVEPER